MAERSDEAFIIVREFMTRGLGLTGLPLLVYARIYGFCESGSPYFESKAHLGKILGVDTRSVVRAVKCHRMTAGRARAAFCMTRRHADP